jgi:hypothetical protein
VTGPATRAALDLNWAASQRRFAERQRVRIQAQEEQRVIDIEVRQTRRALLQALRQRGPADAGALLDEDLLAVIDRGGLCEVIVDVASRLSRAHGIDLQLVDGTTGSLRITAHRGFNADFLAFFATVHPQQGTACAQALVSRRPVLIDDVARSAIFAGHPTREPILDVGSRVVHSYPLVTDGVGIAGVLSFHYRMPPGPNPAALIAMMAARALDRVA